VPRHRLMPHVKERASVCRLSTALIVWPLNRSALAVMRQWVIRVTRTPAFGVAAIMPLVFAGAVGAAAPRFPTPTTALPSAAITPVAVVTAAGSGPAGPAVVAVERPPISLHIAAATVTAPPPTTVVNSPGALGIPATALSAYRNAEQMMAGADPGCGISWNLLAGIGRIESMHANGGATDARGTVIRPIYGPALDGTLPGNEVILQSSIGAQVTYARAMGPMQFLPGTWARYASDGDGDGVADPQNLYDSTLAAARYLCSGGLNLRDQSQVMSAILRYNNSMPYARNVLGWAAAYASGVVPVDLPPVSGPAPPLGDMHLENPEGIGPGLPLNVHGLPSTDPLAQMPLIDLGPSAASPQQPMWPSQPLAPGDPNCTVICIGQPDTLPPQHPPWLSPPPPDAPPSASPKPALPGPSTSPPPRAGPGASPAADTPAAPGPMSGRAHP
jgi:membrane-bound lytic murein transglycosylase B